MKTFLFALLLCCVVPFLFGGSNPRSIKIIRTNVAPIIDGYGDDEVWKQANSADDFIQRDPYEGQPATEKTEVKILYDENNIYFFAMMYDSSPDSIVARLARRDNEIESDYFSIRIDSYHDKQTAFEFTINASGSKVDILQYDDGNKEDLSWDPVWELQTRILSNGWSAEIKIPLSQLRFTEGNDVWGINFIRKISRKRERQDWSLISKNDNGFVSKFGTMIGMNEIKLPHLLEILPYGVTSSEHFSRKADRDKVERVRPNVGEDLKYGLSSNFTLDVTFNPDFAQVEADPAVLNLTTFETFYPEKRPFFIEGTQILRFTTFGGNFGPGLFYSRRIGKGIDVSPPYGSVITDAPSNATILGAAKITGKTENGMSLGILSALTDEEDFSYRDPANNVTTQRAEPRASYNLVRLKQDFFGNSNIGAVVTAVARDSRTPAFTAGTDWNIFLDNTTYRLDGFLARSHSVRATGELRDGSAGKVHFGKVSGEHWLYDVSFDFTSKKYYINDIGFFNSPNDYGVFGTLTYRDQVPGKYFRNYRFDFNQHLRWNFDQLLLFKEGTFNFTSQFFNYWSLSSSFSYGLPAKDPYEPRGFGVLNTPTHYSANAEIASDGRKIIIGSAKESFTYNETGQRAHNISGTMIIRPTSVMEYSFSIGYGHERNRNSFANIITDSMLTFAPSTSVAVFGMRDVDGLDFTLRGSLLFTHNLSLQTYNQFFLAKGHYDTFGILKPDGNILSYHYTGVADFNRTSYITNIVLRWEYREGSTFYFVWSHNRGFRQLGGYNSTFVDNLTNTFSVAPDNVYVVKVSYWYAL